MNGKLKATMWFAAGMAFGEFFLRWVVHAGYISALVIVLYFK